MNQYPSVQVSPNHFVALHEDYLPMITRAPRTDFVVRTLAKRTAGTMPLMSADLVIAGQATRNTFALAEEYPLHFRKTYYPGTMYGDPRIEFHRHTLASTLIELPPPIGHSSDSFRSCLLPGTRLDHLFELGVEPEERNCTIAQAIDLATAAGLWHLTERGLRAITELQEGGLSHSDAHWHNFMVCSAPLAVTPIDFERAILRDAVTPEVWQQHCEADRHHLLRLGIFLQCALGRQRGPLGQQSMDLIDSLVRPAETFRRAIEERTLGVT